MRSLLATARSGAGTLALVAAAALAVACTRRPTSEGGPSAATSTASATPSAKPAVNAAEVRAGAALYQQYCALCHGKDATGYAADNAPSLVSTTFLESASDAFIAAGIRLGRPGTAMGAYGKNKSGPLEEKDIASIIAFLRSFGPKAHALPGTTLRGQAPRGASLYTEHCATCHGTETERKAALSLFNVELLAAATPNFLRYAIVNGRPPTPMPAFAKVLSPNDIEDLLAFLDSKKANRAPSSDAPLEVPKDLPLVINPKGKPPNFTLREERFVPADAVKKALDEKRRIIILDARSPADWLDHHIPGSISLPYYSSKDIDHIPNDGTWVVAYCACPHHASGAVVDGLRAKGFKHTAVLDEGIVVWKQRGYPLDGKTKQ